MVSLAVIIFLKVLLFWPIYGSSIFFHWNFFYSLLFNHQGVCCMTPRHTPTLSGLTQNATLLLQARMLSAIHATFALGTDVVSVPECISAKLPFFPVSPHLLLFSISKKPRWMAFPSFQFTRAHQESSGFYFHKYCMLKRLLKHFSQLSKAISMRHQTSIPESSLSDCRFSLLNLCFIMLLMKTFMHGLLFSPVSCYLAMFIISLTFPWLLPVSIIRLAYFGMTKTRDDSKYINS